MEKFIESIKKNLEMNGFPEKKVALPLEKMYEVADDKSLNFNTVLEVLEKEHGIVHTKETERIIFSKKVESPLENVNLDDLKNMDKDELKKKADEMMSGMTPEQMAEIERMFMNMSPEEKERIMKMGKDMGLV